VGPFTVDILEDLGCSPVGPAPTMAIAREAIESEQFDAAIMDVHIRGERVFPLCDLLAERGIPFLLTSGYADWQMPAEWQARPRLQKPYTFEQLRDALIAVLRSASSRRAALAS
jgi:DNA-binding response OmpR family regulator